MHPAKKEVISYLQSLPSIRHLFFKTDNPPGQLEYGGLRYIPIDLKKSEVVYRGKDKQKIIINHKHCDHLHNIRTEDGWRPMYNGYTGLLTITEASKEGINHLLHSIEGRFPLIDILESVVTDSPSAIDSFQGWCVVIHYAFLLPANGDHSSRLIVIPHITPYWREHGNFRAAFTDRATNATLSTISKAFNKLERYYNVHCNYF